MSSLGNNRGVAIQDMQAVGVHRQVQRDKRQSALVRSQEETGAGCSAQKLTGQKGLQVVMAGALLLGQEGIFLLHLKSKR